MVQSISNMRPEPSRPSGGGRVPPHNIEAEESVLGAMLLSKDAIASAVETVKPEDFYKPAHGHLFDAIQTLYGQGEPVDPVTVAEELRRANLLDALGGKQAILRIQAGTPAAANAAHYARIVEEHALLRRLIGVAGEIAEMGYEMPDDVTNTLDRAETLVFEVANRRLSSSIKGIYPALQESLEQLEALFERDGSMTGVPSGYVDLDELLLGFQPSNLIVVAARPGQGKTSFALGAASHVAMETRKPVVFFSMEMGYLELTQRMLASEAGVNSRLLRTGPDPRERLDEDQPRRRPPGRGAVLHRRQRPPDGDGDAGQVPSPEGTARRPRPRRRRLPPADEHAPPVREPPGRGVRAVPGPEDPGPRPRDPGHGPLPAEPLPRVPDRQAPDARRPS